MIGRWRFVPSRAHAPLTGRPRWGFTLVELLVSIAITGIITGMLAIAITGVNRQANDQRAESQSERLNLLLLQIYEEETERMISAPVSTPQPPPTPVDFNARADNSRRLALLNWQRDYLRCALPDRISDLVDPPIEVYFTLFRGVGAGAAQRTARIDPSYDPPAPPATPNPNPWGADYLRSTRWAAQLRYRQRVWQMIVGSQPATAPANFDQCVDGNPNNGEWTPEFQSAECLYLILATHVVNGEPAIDSIQTRNIGDLDEDGVPEILDPWGTPLGFIRWPGGHYLVDQWELAPTMAEIINRKIAMGKDPLDVLYSDPRYDDSAGNAQADDPFPIAPLIVSAGADRVFDMVGLDVPPLPPIRYAQGVFPLTPNNTLPFAGTPRFIDPYQDGVAAEEQLGAPRDTADSGTDNTFDNIFFSLQQ